MQGVRNGGLVGYRERGLQSQSVRKCTWGWETVVEGGTTSGRMGVEGEEVFWQGIGTDGVG